MWLAMTAAEYLVVMDDEPDIAQFIADVAAELGFAVVTPSSAGAFKEQVRRLKPSLILLDLQMPEADGVELLRHLAEEGAKAGIVLVSGADRKVLDTARRLGENQGLNIAAVLQKPILLERLVSVLRAAQRQMPLIAAEEVSLALTERQLQLYYQPKIELANPAAERLVGVEALVRWQHPRLGLIMPDAFIPVAEANDLMIRLTDYVVDMALRRQKLWQTSGFDIPVAINLPAEFFDDRDLPDRLATLAREHAVQPERVTLEVTESSAMADVNQAMEVFTRLRLKGFLLSIDDFGTGYSSLSQLHRMPFSELKIDKEFVQDLSSNRDSQSIVRSVVALGKGLELKICAEGIEDLRAVEFLRNLGCDYGQGFFYSKALSNRDLIARLSTRRGRGDAAETRQELGGLRLVAGNGDSLRARGGL
jgi:EAL domain-containing protein (putative c-di-GMP-specific phosphodiesterase class I)